MASSFSSAFDPGPVPNDGSAGFKEISLIPNYRALELILENQTEMDTILATNAQEPIFKDITSQSRYKAFREQLKQVEKYLKPVPKEGITPVKLNTEKAAAIGADLKVHFGMKREEVVFILNQLDQPLTDARLEMMFPGRFGKEQVAQLLTMINQHLGLPTFTAATSTEPSISIATPTKEEIKEDE